MIERSLQAGPHHLVRVRCTARADGDYRVDGPVEELAARRRELAAGAWTWLRQVHGARVVEVAAPGGEAGAEADASVTRVRGAVLAVQTADCAPIVLVGDGVVGVVHAGWRGLAAGVISEALAVMGHPSDGGIHALLGPCIGPGGYAFGDDDLEKVVAVAGPSARATTCDGRPALDLPAAVRAVCLAEGVVSFAVVGDDQDATRPADTSGPGWFSHRTRGDTGRQVTVAWLEGRR